MMDDPEKSQFKEQIEAAVRDAEELVFESSIVDLKEAGLSQREALLSVCDRAEMWQSPDGDVYASVPVENHVEHYELVSPAFRGWMLTELARSYRHNDRPASTTKSTVRDARMSLEARALEANVRHPAGLRVAEHDRVTYIDRGTADWSAIAVSGEGWEIVQRPPLPILRSKKAGAFPDLAVPGDLTPLRELLDHLDDKRLHSLHFLVSWGSICCRTVPDPHSWWRARLR